MTHLIPNFVWRAIKRIKRQITLTPPLRNALSKRQQTKGRLIHRIPDRHFLTKSNSDKS